ncbi:general transcription factor IIH subunit 2 [Folsomia candida]|uniref:General transcription factor IIH subunit n=1 Tax=Folsomia candida TaxID=158441 RepID=A0A226E5H0_FOLCA|nr:general transcription factor IIH subunit 2 [Folsomia candida]XP_021956322.1 general transcription factor IIH subunit 2 [Folsomia candida]OXA51786.1 General transcription factor IIH subunit 2 [Folsomia candida]
MGDDLDDKEYRWETGYEKTWEAIEEDADGLLDTAIAEIIEKGRRKRLEERRAAGHVRLGIMRHLYIILDLSNSMMDQDLKPNRILCTKKILEKFVDEFFDGNPMSQLGWIGTRNKKSEKLAELSGNPRKHLEVVRSITDKYPCGGEPSFQNALELALSSLKHMPSHTSREVILIHGSLTTCDPGDINNTIQELKSQNVRCSVISLAAEVRACKALSRSTGGNFNVILDDTHFQDLVHEHVEPPPMAGLTESSLVKMGFPQKNQSDDPSMCLCHLEDTSACKLSTGGYICPQCKSKYCELPVECKVCGLTLVSAPHLARSFLHIFPLEPFDEIDPVDCICFGCHKSLPDNHKHIYRCKQCNRRVCSDCDLFLHETLHCCPGCSSSITSANQLNF